MPSSRRTGTNLKFRYVGYCDRRKKDNYQHIINCTKNAAKELSEISVKYFITSFPTNTYSQTNDANQLYQMNSYDIDMPLLKYWKFPEHFTHIFWIMFEPIPGLAQIINRTMSNLNLVEGKFVSAHVRARYPVCSDSKIFKHFHSYCPL